MEAVRAVETRAMANGTPVGGRGGGAASEVVVVEEVFVVAVDAAKAFFQVVGRPGRAREVAPPSSVSNEAHGRCAVVP